MPCYTGRAKYDLNGDSDAEMRTLSFSALHGRSAKGRIIDSNDDTPCSTALSPFGEIKLYYRL